MNSTDLRALFLGPNGENDSLYQNLFLKILQDTISFRKNFHAQEGLVIAEKLKSEPDFIGTYSNMTDELNKVLAKLKESVPTWDIKYMAHFHGDILIPAVAGYVASILYNPNNVTEEASSATLPMEMDFMEAVSAMIGYKEFDNLTKKYPKRNTSANKILAWGHLTSGGTVANIEAMWVARNLKYLPLTFKILVSNYSNEPTENNVLKTVIEVISSFHVKMPDNSLRKLSELSYFELFNLDNSTCLGMKAKIIQEIKSVIEQSGKDNSFLNAALYLFEDLFRKSNLRSLGLSEIHSLTGLKTPKILISRTCHNTWDKIPEILGLGQNAIVKVDVDENYHINISKLKKIIEEFKNDNQPVLAVIGIFGTTEEGAIDPIHQIIELKNDLMKSNFSFTVHIDAAYGGYYSALFSSEEICKSYSCTNDEIESLTKLLTARIIEEQSHITSGLEEHSNIHNDTEKYSHNLFKDSWIKSVLALKEADSIVIDPHKLGYVPYPAGSIVYKDSRIREQTNFDAPYLEWKEKRIEWSGIEQRGHVYAGKSTLECSRPGAAATACYLTSRVLPLNSTGHGQLLRFTLIITSRFVSIMDYFNKSYEMNCGFRFIRQYNPVDTNVVSWIVGMPEFIERTEYINMLVDEVFSGMTKFNNQSVYNYNYFVSKTMLSYEHYSHVLSPLIDQLITSNESSVNMQRTENSGSESISILRSVLMNPLLFYVGFEHFIGFWQQQIELAKKAIPKILLKLLEEKNDGNRLELIWLENESSVKFHKQHIQYESLLGNHINIQLVVGNHFYYDGENDSLSADGEKFTRTSLVSNNGTRKILIMDLNLFDSDHSPNWHEKIQPAFVLLGSIKKHFGIINSVNSTFVIPCSNYFAKDNEVALSIKNLLKKAYGIEERFCVPKPNIKNEDIDVIHKFSFELVKRIFLVADKILH